MVLSVKDREFENPGVVLAEHKAILSAIRSGDPDRACGRSGRTSRPTRNVSRRSSPSASDPPPGRRTGLERRRVWPRRPSVAPSASSPDARLSLTGAGLNSLRFRPSRPTGPPTAPPSPAHRPTSSTAYRRAGGARRGRRTPRLVRVMVPTSHAAWVDPGVCVNSLGYRHVPGTKVVYREHGQERSFGIASLHLLARHLGVVHFGAVLRSVVTGIVRPAHHQPRRPRPPGRLLTRSVHA